MRRLIGIGLAGALLLALGCGPANYPKENPRLPKHMQDEAATATGTESGEAAAGTETAPAEGDAAPPAEGGG